MSDFNFVASAPFGLEACVKHEAIKMGLKNIKVSNGKVEFTGDFFQINIVLLIFWLLILMVCMMWLGMVHLIILSLEMAIMITTHQESWSES